ncbi:tRNA(Ile)-lysidine synthase [Candidatus Blochmanniella chromaiodes str. 640]|uniref:tRNA(Ile)-lysidine synthase n=1 Tax=Candidatus Blochmanniella chromaiodes str. 640 TaxID=1240471 RepID=A0ABN4AXZ5_9ENTR|nr:tRNA lysidine(34) synthetase TilS [Candidatus Blochmannia chromaiodes]AGC03569.1 tRNA(Ile)-lysidine synthase [Candidatus Blochmannia chromaiodes str. 640]
MITTNTSSENWDLYRKVTHCLVGHTRLLLSYSGGLDSTVLLDILTRLKNNSDHFTLSPFMLRAIYIHHGISNYSDEWASHCFNQCKIRGIPFSVIHINCYNTENKQRNIEALARNLRYKKLYNRLNSKEILLTAHHMNDQVESLFLALKRGSGPSGLSGMSKNALYANKYRLLRPLLDCSREQLEIYAYKKKLVWIEDDTNTDTRFDRNFLRIKILPSIYQRWPCFNQVVARTAQLCRDQENLLNELLSESFQKLIDESDGSLLFIPLFQYSIPKRQALLRRWLSHLSMKMPSYQLINRIWKEVVLSRKDATPILQLDKYLCRRFREKLYILPVNMRCSLNRIELSWNIIHNVFILPYNLGKLIYQPLSINEHVPKNPFDLHLNIDSSLNTSHDVFEKYKKVLTHCFVRSPKSDEKISIIFGNIDGLLYILGRNRGRHLKKIWQELGVPPWLRSRIPLLFYNKTLITAIGVFITQNGKITSKENTLWKISWLQDIISYKIFKNSVRYHLE